MERTKNMIFTSLFGALIFCATYFIKIQTPAFGYIHPGDGLVLLSGALLGPLYGGFAAGMGSMLSDLLGGYVTYAPATFVIKALCAVIFYCLIYVFPKRLNNHLSMLLSGIVAELFMCLSYFAYDVFLLSNTSGGSLSAAMAASVSDIPFNLIQGVFGVIIVSILYPLCHRILLTNGENRC
ncbi:MAG: ECF transporter S component [Lachnospiraceae bacterium]|nr:ECF transporter S component [Lachnospiraceae bacterium]